MRLLITILSICATVVYATAQISVELSDTNFRNALCEVYDTTMDETCTLLDTVVAEKLDDMSITLRNKNLKAVPEIAYFNRIDSIDLSYNQLTEFIDVKSNYFWSLEYLDLSNNQLEVLPHLSTSKTANTLRHLYFQNNKITEIQNFWGFWDTLIVLNISGNLLTDFPDASRAKEATLIDVSNNFLSFEDIIPLTAHVDFENVFNVFPQRKIAWPVTAYEGRETEAITLHIDIDNNVTTNTYEWYRNDVLLTRTKTNILQIDSLELDDAGTYHVIVKNSNASLQNVYLESEDIQLTVEPCMDITFFEHSLASKCYGASISFDPTSITGGTTPYVFTIKDENNKQTELHGDNDKLLSGTYELLVEDKAACKKILQKTLLIEAKENCDEHVITPNGDGVQDDIYFSQEGEGVVYNQFGQEIKVLALPAHWDAKDENENVIPPGKYMIVINGKDAISLKVVW